MHKYKCPKCGQGFATDIRLAEPPVCNRRDRRASHPARMEPVLVPRRA